MSEPNAARAASEERSERLAAALARAREGDVSGMDEIVRSLNPLLWHVARSQGASRDDVPDVVQLAWLELTRHLHTIDNPLALTAWLVTTTRRAAWRSARRGRAEELVPETPEVTDTGPTAVDRILTDERDQILWRAFERLTERCRRLLRLVALQERPDYRSAGEVLGMPHGSLGPTRARCLAKLRDLLVADPEWVEA